MNIIIWTTKFEFFIKIAILRKILSKKMEILEDSFFLFYKLLPL